jgi:hypothetical protein
MKERGRYQIQLMKTRSSSGVGTKVDLDFDIESLRITDPGEDAQGTPGSLKPQVGSVMAQIKAKSNVEGDDAARPSGTAAWDKQPAATGDIQSTKLKAMLSGLKSNVP